MNIENIGFDFSNLKFHLISESLPLPTEENIFQKMLREFLEDYEKNPIYRKEIKLLMKMKNNSEILALAQRYK